ncbi:hypothetical protein [Arenimonas sp. MALMAid1274]|uniref:hypothetical protein n=1 Tax=Arenimonas sp. MALMAid1274 TaxID=3411630 RepID=UPI003BA258F4
MKPACLLLFALACQPVLAAVDDFDTKLAKARENLASEAGAAYDRKLGLAMQALPALVPAMKDCATRHPEQQDVHGYFEFTAGAPYRVVLRPASPYAGCLEKALSGHDVPAPPQLPWYNHFLFATDPAG